MRRRQVRAGFFRLSSLIVGRVEDDLEVTG
jgi:hypothetical protein